MRRQQSTSARREAQALLLARTLDGLGIPLPAGWRTSRTSKSWTDAATKLVLIDDATCQTTHPHGLLESAADLIERHERQIKAERNRARKYRAEVQRLRKLTERVARQHLLTMIEHAEHYAEDSSPCDHAANHCVCGLRADIDDARAFLKKKKEVK